MRPWTLSDFSAESTTPENCPFNTPTGSADWECTVAQPSTCSPFTSAVTQGVQYSCGWCSTEVCSNCKVHLPKTRQRIKSTLGTKVASLYCIECWESLQTQHSPLGVCNHCNRYVWAHYYGTDWSQGPDQVTPRYFHPCCENRFLNQRIDQLWSNVSQLGSPEAEKPKPANDSTQHELQAACPRPASTTPPPSPQIGSR